MFDLNLISVGCHTIKEKDKMAFCYNQGITERKLYLFLTDPRTR